MDRNGSFSLREVCFSFSRDVLVMKKKFKQIQADSDKKDAKLYENMFAHKIKV